MDDFDVGGFAILAVLAVLTYFTRPFDWWMLTALLVFLILVRFAETVVWTVWEVIRHE